jgi:hypothetical protein
MWKQLFVIINNTIGLCDMHDFEKHYKNPNHGTTDQEVWGSNPYGRDVKSLKYKEVNRTYGP